MHRALTAISLTVLLLSGLACAKHRYASVDEVFIRYDVNKDGMITKEEFVSQWKDKIKGEAAWKVVDKESSGALSRAQAANVPLDVWSSLETDNMQ